MILGIKSEQFRSEKEERERKREKRKATIRASQSGSANYERGGSKRGFVAW